MKPDISEFSFGYAITENLIQANAFGLQAAPIFPSLIEEGRKGGGYDVQLPFNGMPLFLQFKLSDYLKGSKAKEAIMIGVPFYRMHLRPLRHSDQHRMLLELESSGQLVYYVAPKFHLTDEFNEAYLTQRVVERSVFILPSYIGDLDDENHYVVFKDGADPLVCSKPKIIKEPIDFQTFSRHTLNRVRQVGELTADPRKIHNIQETLINIIEREKLQKNMWKRIDRHSLQGNRPLLQQTAYLSRTFFGCEMFVVRAT